MSTINSKCHVLHVTGIMNAGGTESLIMTILRNKKGDVEHILCICAPLDEIGVYDEEIAALGVKTIRISKCSKSGTSKYIDDIKKTIVFLGNIDIVHCHLNALSGLVAIGAKRALVKRTIAHSHANISFRYSIIRNMIEEFKLVIMKLLIARYATDYWACSPEAAKRLFIKRKKAVIINNSIDVDDYMQNNITSRENIRSNFGVSENEILICSIGRISRIKNYDFMMKIIKNITHFGLNVKYYIIGRIDDQDYYEELVQQIKLLDISDRVIFYGNSNSVNKVLAGCDIFAMPSISEGLGIAALEAQAASVPVIASMGVPTEADMDLGLMERLPFNEELWIKSIVKLGVKKRNLDMSHIKDSFAKKGFDSSKSVESIEKKYCQLCDVKYMEGNNE